MPANRLPLRHLPLFFLSGRSKRFSWGKCIYSPTPLSGKESRFSIIVPKTTLKLSTDRNKLKRQLFAVFQKYELSPPLDFVVIIHRAVPAQVISSDILSLFTA